MRMYKSMVVDKMGPMDRRKMSGSRLIDFAGATGLSSPSWARNLDTSVSFPASLKGSLPEAVRNGATNLGIRIRNMDTFVNDDIYNPNFYLEFNRILRNVSAETGMPIEVLSSALASASAQAAPYDEVLRLARVAPLVRVANGQADVVPGGLQLLGDDTMAISALRGFTDTINNPDFLTVKPAGQAMKTSAYAYNRLDPLYVPVYVSDTVDGLGQFLIAGGSPGTSKAQSSIVNQIAGRTLASVYDVSPSAMQEALWSHIRVARDGLKATRTGKPTGSAIAPAFTGEKGSIESILIDAIKQMDEQVVTLAQRNRDRFYADVRRGDVNAWQWDGAQNRPVISSSDYLIPADQRPVAGGRAVALQNEMLSLVEGLGPTLRSRLIALSATTGISLAALVAALGDATADIPEIALSQGGRESA